ncbi:MAG: SUF system NifU family Fe-S cluster assembly protein [Erysipelotrichaceae bacterium]
MSDMLKDPMILRQIIMDHYEFPRNHELSKSKDYNEIHMASDSCIDDIYVQAKFEGDTIKDIRFDGVACTISTASTSIMSELLVGKSIQEAKVIIDNYYAMINQNDYDEELLEEAVAFHGVGAQANRIKCATIGWNAIVELMEKNDESK